MRHIRMCVLAAFGLLFLLVPAYGHAVLVSASPAANTVVKGPDVSLQLKFSSRIDAKRSRLLLISPDGKEHVLRIDEASPPDYIYSKMAGIASGSYVLRWQVLAEDGHITRGEVPFRIQ